ncbi:MAG: hypothetical protein NVSMB4_19950 [Acidimicrobiales bacterium]
MGYLLSPVASSPAPDTILRPLNGPPRPLSAYLGMFHLVLAVLDPYTNESAWILDTAGRVLETFNQADCRVGWLVAAGPDECRQFLGPWTQQHSTFCDPDRTVIKALGLDRLPALVHLAQDATLVGSAEGWDPLAWRMLTDDLATVLSWKGPNLPGPKDPAPYEGTPALG